MTRKSKIARLPREIRDQLNRRLDEGEVQANLVEWLNSLQEVHAVLHAEFGDRPLTEQNLSEWKQGGFRDWLFQQEAIELVRQMDAEADELNQASKIRLTDLLARQMAARYVIAARSLRQHRLSEPNGPEDPAEVERGHKRLRELCGDIVALRRGDHMAEGLDLERERLGLLERDLDLKRVSKCDILLDGIVEEVRGHPKVSVAFDAFMKALREVDGTSAAPSQSDQIQPNPTSEVGS
jgi:hypothetical protein